MRMAALVHQHAVHGGAQVGAVVQVEATQVELVRLAFAAVLADHEAGRGFEQFAGAVDGARFELFLRHGADAGGVGHADLLGGGAGDDDLFENLFAARKGRAGKQRRGECRADALSGKHVESPRA